MFEESPWCIFLTTAPSLLKPVPVAGSWNWKRRQLKIACSTVHHHHSSYRVYSYIIILNVLYAKPRVFPSHNNFRYTSSSLVFNNVALIKNAAVGSLWPPDSTTTQLEFCQWGGEAVLNLEQTACFSNVCGGHIRSTDDCCVFQPFWNRRTVVAKMAPRLVLL